MGLSLTEIAQELNAANKKVQLIYAFNGSGKTRLSREFKQLIAPKTDSDEDIEQTEPYGPKIFYYNAFTEDLFYWDNDLHLDTEPKLKIQPNSFTQWVLQDQGQDRNIVANFQHYTDEKLTPHFSEDFSEVTFSFERGNNERSENIKISKGEESNFIWSVFYSLLEQVIEVLNVAEPGERETNQFNQLEYVFIDDPISSLDENHLIELAADLARLIKSSQSTVKFIITTHNPLFYNVLHNEFKQDRFKKYLLKKYEDGEYELVPQPHDSPFSYHLYLKAELEKAIVTGLLNKYHFNFLRNILEKTSTFLGYQDWTELLPPGDDGRPNPYEARIINISSHSKHAGEETIDLTENDKRVLEFLVRETSQNYRFKQRNS
ncbi:AAA family ATPase [Pontibacter pamirensis]|uniref:AAA family ATPase n=1 Tax=Pontibacter pamirensis TaxID=2562824 RepID=UPI00138A6C1A|nr:AAA family ATPase [Pontibacter pamirensis]